MRRLFHAAVFSTGVLTAVHIGAQEKPNLSGTWVFDHDETPAEAKGTVKLEGGVVMRLPESVFKNGNLGPTLTLTQDETTLKLIRPAPGNSTDGTFVLDGSQANHRKPDVNGKPGAEWISRSSWDGSKLVINSVEDAFTVGASRGPDGQITPGEKMAYKLERKLTLSLATDGKLVSESTSKSAMGGWGPTSRSVYKKG